MGNDLAASGRLPAADRHVMFWICGVGDLAANQKNRAAVHCGYHKAAAVTYGYRPKILQGITVRAQNECVNAALVEHNTEIIAATKEADIDALRARETKDIEIAAQKGWKPYILLGVEFNDVTEEKSSGHMGWYSYYS